MKTLRVFSLLILFILVLGRFSWYIEDPDVWWHLKTGEYIFQNKAIPENDPFTFTTPQPPSDRGKFILTSYWLGQLALYLVYSFNGFKGVILLQAIIFTAIFIILYRRMRSEGVGFYLTFGLLFLGMIMSWEFQGGRPQLFSFLFTVILIYLLERFRSHSTRYTLYTIPLLMLLWANTHGGFILGDVIIFIYIISETSKYILKSSLLHNTRYITSRNVIKKDHLIRLVIVGAIAILFSFLNPNTYKIIYEVYTVHTSILVEQVSEHLSPIQKFLYKKELRPLYWATILSGILLILANIKRIDLTDLALMIFGIAISLSAVRYIIFYFLISIPLWGRYSHVLLEDLKNKAFVIRLTRGFDYLQRYFIVDGIIFIFLLFFTWNHFEEKRVFRFEMRDLLYPVRAASFIKEYKPTGNMYNEYNWGGYLIWRLYPDYKVFIDSRTLDEKVNEEATTIVNGADGWKEPLYRYKINFIIHDACNIFYGDIWPFILKLMNDREWELVYMDGRALIFVRNIKENRRLIEKFRLPKERVYDEIILEAMKGMSKGLKLSGFYTSMGLALIGKGDYQKAKMSLLKAVQINPKDQSAINMLQIINIKDGKQ